ncbi:hypothetical protein [Nocardioides limicola]|uniref:hypothetical protein n=1 Tax=Nocardioides limicola TaxID=2803368 RepID=UPI00193B5475|nr:hypothetical protein [Nocardioides sp. DJM-14]
MSGFERLFTDLFGPDGLFVVPAGSGSGSGSGSEFVVDFDGVEKLAGECEEKSGELTEMRGPDWGVVGRSTAFGLTGGGQRVVSMLAAAQRSSDRRLGDAAADLESFAEAFELLVRETREVDERLEFDMNRFEEKLPDQPRSADPVEPGLPVESGPPVESGTGSGSGDSGSEGEESW